MKDKPLIVVGLIVGIALLTFPLWYPKASGSAVPPPKLKVPEGKKCVEDGEYMRAHHMELLDQWRDDVVREGKKTYKSKDGTTHEMSLTRTCLDCHAEVPDAESVSCEADRPEGSGPTFCFECHNYANVEVICWDCHLEPQEIE
jgi:hypothetical protein